jgi:F0F1-type ATP synthase membrane subunit b/b'
MTIAVLFASSGGDLVDLDGTVFIQAAIFASMFVFLYFALFKPFIELFNARDDATEGEKKRAAELKAKARVLSDELETRISNLKQELLVNRNQILDAARSAQRDALLKAREAARKEIQNAEEAMIKKRITVKKAVSEEVYQLADLVVSSLLSRRH